MSRMHRAGMWLVCGALAGGVVATAEAQIQGMPLFTNPRYGSGVRVHADLGLPADKNTTLGDYNVVQGGVTFAIGPVGLGVNLGSTRNDFGTITSGTSSATLGAQAKVTASALAQIRIAGGGLSPLSLSLFGGASMDVKGFDFANLSSLPQFIQDSINNANPKILTIPVGLAVGLKIPLGIASPNVWGAPRLNMRRVINCPSGFTCSTESKFRWAAGVDLPIFGIISVRAAYDSGELAGKTVNYFGLGASIGLGGMR